eukprot:7075527-Lingulodinium_polyedra.AAC.1
MNTRAYSARARPVQTRPLPPPCFPRHCGSVCDVSFAFLDTVRVAPRNRIEALGGTLALVPWML